MKLEKRVDELKHFIILSISLAKAEFKLRNEGSYLGILWYLLYPILTFILLLVVFSYNLGSNIQYYSLYLLIGIIMYNFFQQVTSSAILNIKDNRLLIKSIKFPRESLVASVLFRNIFSHLFEFILLIIIFILFKASINSIIFYLPIFFFYCIFIYGCSLIVAGLYAYLSDIDYIWSFFTRLLFFATPIFYSVAGMKNILILNLFNPLYYFITITRDITLYGKFPELYLIYGVLFFSIFSFILGSIIFNKLKIKFADLL